MEVDVPCSIRDIIKTHKRLNVKGDSYLKFSLDTTQNNTVKPKIFTPILLDLPSTEVPAVSVLPSKNFTIKRQRSSSTSSVSKQMGMKRSKARKNLELLERTQNSAKACNETMESTYNPGLVTVHKSVLLEEKPAENNLVEQSYNFKGKTEPPKIQLGPLFRIEKFPRKGITQRIRLNTSACERVEPAASVTQPQIPTELTPRGLVFGKNVREEVLMKHAAHVFEGINYAVNNVKPLPASLLRPLQVSLKRGEPGKRSLVLDLDETLIHARRIEDLREKGLPIDGIECYGFNVKVRPYVEEFLREMSKEFEIIIFTAAERNYAENMVQLLDPNHRYISHILHRDHCLKTKRGLSIKDLRIIIDRDLKDMVIVDNFTPSFSFQIDNGIPIITWDGDVRDEELKYLVPYLLEAKKYTDMRQYNREKLRLEELANVSAQKFLSTCR